MSQLSDQEPIKRICVGLLAHVDAGKTTLTEAMLYQGGSLRKLGRVDHGDAFLDTDAQERARGITIYSKQARLTLPQRDITLLDTPGHVDFSTEMERTLQVLDYAILLISGTDGIQGHTRTLWQLLARHQIPTFLFVNKMDLPGLGHEHLMKILQKQDARCVDFSEPEDERNQALAVCEEEALAEYLETGALSDETITRLIARRQVLPCLFGAALKPEGVQALLEALRRWTRQPDYPAQFGARVFKISRDSQGRRLTHMKDHRRQSAGQGPAPRRRGGEGLAGEGRPAAAVLRGKICHRRAGAGRRDLRRHRPEPHLARHGPGHRAGRG